MVPTQTRREEDAALARALGLTPAEVAGPPKNALQRVVPCCADCNKRLLADSRAYCKECRSIVCRNDKRCHRGHMRKHLQEMYNRRAVTMSQKTFREKVAPQMSEEDFLKMMAAPDTTFTMDESAEVTTEQVAAMAALMPTPETKE